MPSRDDAHLFEMLLLEGAQAGLSWLTILRKREGFRRALAGFDPQRLARFGEADLAACLADPGIVRNRLKLEAARDNARAYLELVDAGASLTDYLWDFVDGQPIVNAWESLEQVPVETGLSRELSRDLKRRGFRFVGPTICYAFMQAVGLVMDHTTDCFRHRELAGH